MASPAARSTASVGWSIQAVSLAGLTFPIARLQVRIYLGTTPPGPQDNPEKAWLDTGAPLSVVPFHLHNKRLAWQPLGVRVTWSGQPCELGRLDVWLPTDQPPYLRGPFSLLAKFADSDPPGDPVPLLLGLEFLLAHQIELRLPCPPRQGTMMLP